MLYVKFLGVGTLSIKSVHLKTSLQHDMASFDRFIQTCPLLKLLIAISIVPYEVYFKKDEL